MKADLSKTISFEKMVGWKIHWTKCKLWDLEKEASRSFSHERVASMLESLQDIWSNHQQYIWEVATMLEHNYHSYDVIEYLKDVPKYQEMLELLQTVKEKILSMHQASIEQDTTQLNVKLEKLSKY
jgi:hypothetical protein